MLLVAWHVVVDVYYGSDALPTLARAYGEWGLMYAAGRYAVLHRGALAGLAPWFAGVASVIAVASIAESLTGINLWESVFHVADDRVSRPQGERYGIFHRAIGMTRHPIFLGVILMLLTAWSGIMIDSANESNRKRFFGWMTLLLVIAGVVVTGSRGPVLGLCGALCFGLSLSSRIARWAIAIGVLVGGIGLTFNFDRVIHGLDAIGGERRAKIVRINGDAELYTGTRNRMFVVQIYGPIAMAGGPLGYGTEATDRFPPNVPGLPTDPESKVRLRIVDNTYILIALRFGIVGVVLFSALLLGAIWTCVVLRRVAGTYFHPCSAGSMVVFASVLFGVSLELLTVYCDFDFLPWILFHCGVVSGLYAKTRVFTAG
ncbi:O-antigen ligase family protein [Stieleria sp. TO1_6]|nr:O-antigen ligase family protein [Stieleria tagensis]